MSKFLPNKILLYQLYIMQLEEYDSKRFLNSLFKKGILPAKNLRKKLVYTAKAKLIILLTLIQQALISTAFAYLLNITVQEIWFFSFCFIVSFYILIIISFIFITQTTDILLYPFEQYAKKRLIEKAKLKIKTLEHLNVIGITGSYGKTTMKEVLSTILSETYKVVKTEGNNNTPIGIARTILNKVNKNTEIFIVEMGEYVKGDVKALCDIVQPDISIITGINEAHLERYKTMENAISTKFEIVEYAKKDAVVLLNADDELIAENYEKYIGDHFRVFFSSQSNDLCEYKVDNYKFLEDGSGQSFELVGREGTLGNIKVSILGEYIIGNIIASVVTSKMLGMKDSQIRLGIAQIKPIKHRLEAQMNPNNIIVIDDTYNGNSNGFIEGMNTLAKFKDRRKVYVTPGLVETGFLKEKLHIDIGQSLAKVADLIILIRNSSTEYIYKGLVDAGFNKDKVVWYDNSKVVWEKLYENLEPGDVVMLQNDWSDNYY